MINLCFHGIGRCLTEREAGEARYWVEVDLFRRILDEVAGHDDIALSFDDGNRSDVDTALPELLARGLRADFFIIAGRLDDGASLGRDDLRALRQAGMGVGSHGWNHVPWRGLSPEAEDVELVAARAALAEASGGRIDTAALPLGRYDRRLLAALRRGGYRRVYTSDRMPARAEAWLQARYSVTGGDSVESVRGIIEHRFGAHDLSRSLVVAVKKLR